MNAVRTSWTVMLALLGVALVVRLLALPLPGHDGDVRVMAGWAERMAAVGPWSFYDASGSVYPALLYVLWPLGLLLDGAVLEGVIKGLSIPFDLALGVLLFVISRPGVGEGRALVVAALFLVNPAAIIAGAIWGQVDSAGTLFFVAALAASAGGRHGWGGALGMAAALFKPQFGLVMLPVLGVAVIGSFTTRRWRPVADVLGGAVGAYVIVGLPLLLHPPRYLGILLDTATRQPLASVYAFNPWGLLLGFETPDGPYALAGALLLLAGAVLALLPLRRSTTLPDLLGSGTLVVLAFYFLPTRVHERYLFASIALLALLAVRDRALAVAYLGLSVGFAASLLHVLHATTSFRLPEPLGEALTSDAGTWAVGLALIASALLAVVGIARAARPQATRGPSP